jgi:hypothetical protein
MALKVTRSTGIWEVEDRGAKRVSEIARAVKGAEKLILATDPDREGEAISWHVIEALTARKALKGIPVERVTFNASLHGAGDLGHALGAAILHLPDHGEVGLRIDRAVLSQNRICGEALARGRGS